MPTQKAHLSEIPGGNKKAHLRLPCVLVRPLILPGFIGIPEKGSAGRNSVVPVRGCPPRNRPAP
jgi:hypothetical protein